MLLGLISDTHGLLRPEVFTAFEGVNQILHAGDIGEAGILIELEAIAPTSAVWGNTDGWELQQQLPEQAEIEFEDLSIRIVHGHQFGRPNARDVARSGSGFDLIVFGHSHMPEIERVGRTLAVNPGSAGPARFSLPITVAIVELKQGKIEARLVELVQR